PAADLERSEPYLERLELAIEAMQQDARGLAGTSAAERLLQRLGAVEENLGVLLRALRGEDQSAGIAPVTEPSAAAGLQQANASFEELRSAIGELGASRAAFTTAETAARQVDTAAAQLLERFRAARLAA